MPTNYFDEQAAARYEQRAPHIYEPDLLDRAVDFLCDLAGPGPVLELGVGTGRVAIPINQRGLAVHGIDLSPQMAARLRGDPRGHDVEVTIGDFATTKVDGTFTLAFLVRNTIMNLATQDEQVQCFCNAAEHLEPGGYFVIEVVVPALRRLPPGERARIFAMTSAHVGVEEYTDLVDQISYSHHWWNIDGELETFSAPFRYVWPSELDLMARLAGLTLHERWSDWNRAPFTSESESHVSVWRKPG